MNSICYRSVSSQRASVRDSSCHLIFQVVIILLQPGDFADKMDHLNPSLEPLPEGDEARDSPDNFHDVAGASGNR